MTESNLDTKRWCYPGDTVSTVKPMSEFAGSHAGSHLNAICDTAEACAEANNLIAAGRWKVTRCGTCQQRVESCQCPGR